MSNADVPVCIMVYEYRGTQQCTKPSSGYRTQCVHNYTGCAKKKRATQNIHKQNSKIAPSLMGPYGFENFEGFFFHLNLLIMSDRTVKYEDNVIQNYKLNFIKNIKIKYRT